MSFMPLNRPMADWARTIPNGAAVGDGSGKTFHETVGYEDYLESVRRELVEGTRIEPGRIAIEKTEEVREYAEKIDRDVAQDCASEGNKFDQGKPRYELITGEFLEELALVLTFGAEKYDDRNWEKGMAWSRPFGAMMRHAWAWFRGESRDPETGLSHMAHVGANACFLLTFQARGSGTDDRPG